MPAHALLRIVQQSAAIAVDPTVTIKAIPVAAMPLLAAFGIYSVWLSIVDVRYRLLPNRILRPALVIIEMFILFASAAAGDWWALLRSLGGGAALFVVFLGFALLRPADLGGGDVKLVALTGVVSGWFGWWQLVVGIMSAAFIGAAIAITIMVLHRGRAPTFAFGPALLAGTWVGILAGPFLGG